MQTLPRRNSTDFQIFVPDLRINLVKFLDEFLLLSSVANADQGVCRENQPIKVKLSN